MRQVKFTDTETDLFRDLSSTLMPPPVWALPIFGLLLTSSTAHIAAEHRCLRIGALVVYIKVFVLMPTQIIGPVSCAGATPMSTFSLHSTLWFACVVRRVIILIKSILQALCRMTQKRSFFTDCDSFMQQFRCPFPDFTTICNGKQNHPHSFRAGA